MSYAIDTHCHLSFIPKADRKGVVERALKANVKKMITVACNLEEIGLNLPIADEYDFIYTTAGVHPTECGEQIDKDLEKVFHYAKNEPKVVAIGEIGLDYYHDKFPHDLQMAYMAGQLNIAKELGLPAILHSRAGKFAGENATVFPDMADVLKRAGCSKAVMHCFSGSQSEADLFLEMGLMLSFTGIITYDRNEELRKIINKMPLERIMIETDAPFLPPKKHKGKKNEPAFVTEVAKTIAEVKEMKVGEVLEFTTENAERFFGI